jgi:hypothetical protein
MIAADRRQTRAFRGTVAALDSAGLTADIDVGEFDETGAPVLVESVPVVGATIKGGAGSLIIAGGDAWFIPSVTPIVDHGPPAPTRASVLGHLLKAGPFTATYDTSTGKTTLTAHAGMPANATILDNNVIINVQPVTEPASLFATVILEATPAGRPNNYHSSVTLSWRERTTPGHAAVRVNHVGRPTEEVHFSIEILYFE